MQKFLLVRLTQTQQFPRDTRNAFINRRPVLQAETVRIDMAGGKRKLAYFGVHLLWRCPPCSSAQQMCPLRNDVADCPVDIWWHSWVGPVGLEYCTSAQVQRGGEWLPWTDALAGILTL